MAISIVVILLFTALDRILKVILLNCMESMNEMYILSYFEEKVLIRELT